jgi:hypothetical protein
MYAYNANHNVTMNRPARPRAHAAADVEADGDPRKWSQSRRARLRLYKDEENVESRVYGQPAQHGVRRNRWTTVSHNVALCAVRRAALHARTSLRARGQNAPTLADAQWPAA